MNRKWVLNRWFYPYFVVILPMAEWHYVQDVKNDKVDEFLAKAAKKHTDRVYKIGTARSNNPGMTAVYYKIK